MYINSVNNFFSAYVAILKLVFAHNRLKLTAIVAFYGVAIVLYLNCLVSLFMLIQMIGKGESEITIDPVLLAPITFEVVTVFIALISTYIASTVALYIAESLWYRLVSRIVRKIVHSYPGELVGPDRSIVAKGANSAIRIGGLLFKNLFPVIIGVASALALLYFNPFIFISISLIGVVSLYFIIGVGQKAKKIGAYVGDDDEDEDDMVIADSKDRRLDKRLSLLADFFQLRAKGILISNIILAGMFGAAAYNWLITNPSLADATDLIISLALLRLIYAGISAIVTKSVPLSRHYPFVRDFLIITDKNRAVGK